MSEANLHKSVREAAYAEHGHIDLRTGKGKIKIFKMTMLGHMGEGGWPDMAIFIKGGHTIFIELKNPDGSGECSDLQLQRHAELRALGFPVYVTDNRAVALSVIRKEVKHAKR